MVKQKKKEKKNKGQIIFMVLMIGAGVVLGVASGVRSSITGANETEFWMGEVSLILSICLAMILQIIIHEAGHLVFGLLSGYKFCSFRIGNVMLLKEDDKWVLRNYSLAGTGGQCLMSPPDFVDGKIPVVLYNFGGCIMNVIASILFVAVAVHAGSNELVFTFSISMILIGITFALTNGIPLQVGMINNDGMNAISLGKNPAALRAFWTQLRVNEELTRGKRLKEMSPSYFAIPAESEMGDTMVATIAVFHANWLMDQVRLEEAEPYIKALLAKKTGISGLHRSILISERIYLELVVNKNVDEAIRLHDKAHEKFVKAMKTMPSIIRTEYAYALLAEKDEEKAKKILDQFEKNAKTYPYPREIEGERELIARVQNENNN